MKNIIGKVYCLLLCIGFITSVKAQNMDTVLRHQLFISAAFNHADTHDEQASPILYYGNGDPLGLGYEYRGNSYRHSIHFSSSVSGVNASEFQPDIQNDPFQRKVIIANIFLTYAYLRDWQKTMDGNLQYSLGFALDNVAFLRIYKYNGSNLFSSGGAGTWDELNMLSPAIRADYIINADEKLYSQLLLPMVSLIGRPGYNLRTSNSKVLSGSDFHVVFIGGLLAWNYALTFEQRVWDALLLSASYNSRYYRYTRYDWTTATLIQDITLQIRWRFGL